MKFEYAVVLDPDDYVFYFSYPDTDSPNRKENSFSTFVN